MEGFSLVGCSHSLWLKLSEGILSKKYKDKTKNLHIWLQNSINCKKRSWFILLIYLNYSVVCLNSLEINCASYLCFRSLNTYTASNCLSLTRARVSAELRSSLPEYPTVPSFAGDWTHVLQISSLIPVHKTTGYDFITVLFLRLNQMKSNEISSSKRQYEWFLFSWYRITRTSFICPVGFSSSLLFTVKCCKMCVIVPG